MAKVVVTAKVADAAKWEEGFRTHGDLFRKQTVSKPISFTVAGNQVVAVFEPQDLDKYMAILDSEETREAMEFDGIDRDTVSVYTLDGEFDPR